jgi:pSer/pThr/pTyr-binding forkhead associated (FHA) protein
LASTNGTRLGDRAVSADTPIALGDPFKVGRTLLRVSRL